MENQIIKGKMKNKQKSSSDATCEVHGQAKKHKNSNQTLINLNEVLMVMTLLTTDQNFGLISKIIMMPPVPRTGAA